MKVTGRGVRRRKKSTSADKWNKRNEDRNRKIEKEQERERETGRMEEREKSQLISRTVR